MPLYEYYCKDCENQFSEVLTVKEHKKQKIHCPKCKRANVKEVIERSLPLGSEQRGPGRSGGL
jgi:putative FmdB family regulatory protein